MDYIRSDWITDLDKLEKLLDLDIMDNFQHQ